jgi:hypothetical protein
MSQANQSPTKKPIEKLRNDGVKQRHEISSYARLDYTCIQYTLQEMVNIALNYSDRVCVH